MMQQSFKFFRIPDWLFMMNNKNFEISECILVLPLDLYIKLNSFDLIIFVQMRSKPIRFTDYILCLENMFRIFTYLIPFHNDFFSLFFLVPFFCLSCNEEKMRKEGRSLMYNQRFSKYVENKVMSMGKEYANNPPTQHIVLMLYWCVEHW